MLLPARRLHDRCDGCTVGLPEQCRHRLLLAAGAGRVYRGRLRLLARGAALLATHRLAWFGIFLCDITGSSLVMTVNLPSPPKPRSGECDGGAGSRNECSLARTPTATRHLRSNTSPFRDHLVAESGPQHEVTSATRVSASFNSG